MQGMVAHNCHGKTKNVTAKTKYLTAKPKTSQRNQKPHGKNKNIMAKPKTSRQKQNTSRQNQKPHGKNKIPHGKTKYFTAKQLWFCREVFVFFRDSCGPPYVGLEPAPLDVKSICVSTTPSRANCRYRLILTYST